MSTASSAPAVSAPDRVVTTSSDSVSVVHAAAANADSNNVATALVGLMKVSSAIAHWQCACRPRAARSPRRSGRSRVVVGVSWTARPRASGRARHTPPRRWCDTADPMKSMKPTFFATPAAFRAWLAANHTKAAELLVRFHKVGSGKPSITWPQSVDQALCYGWIDGVRRSLGATSYTIRFTPRRPRSIWSAYNTNRFGALSEQGQVAAAGIASFKQRTAARPASTASSGASRPACCPPRRRRSARTRPRGPTSSRDRPGTSGPPCTGWSAPRRRRRATSGCAR